MKKVFITTVGGNSPHHASLIIDIKLAHQREMMNLGKNLDN